MNYGEKSPALWDAIKSEEKRQEDTIELIASENIVSDAVREAQGSVLTNKYAEGYPGKRYYGGCQYIDKVEQLAIDYAKKLFNAEYANVQPHSGSQANMTVYNALLKPGDTILGMGMDAGGHLTHGSKVNFSGKIFNSISYDLNPETEELDFERIRQIAIEKKPKLIIAGVVTTTTHKTLRGPRGGMILSNNKELGKKIDSALFPGTQGGPLEHVIAAKAQAFYEDLQPEFTQYIDQVIKNSKAMAEEFKNSKNIRVVSDGTDNHLMIIDITKTGVTGKDAQNLLDSVNITTNKESIPGDKRSPFITSGLRIGTPAITSRGFKESDAKEVAKIIIEVLDTPEDAGVLAQAKERVNNLVTKYPIK